MESALVVIFLVIGGMDLWAHNFETAALSLTLDLWILIALIRSL